MSEGWLNQRMGWQVTEWCPLDSKWYRLVRTALLAGTVSVLEAISIARALGDRHGDKIDANQELLGALLPSADSVVTQARCAVH